MSFFIGLLTAVLVLTCVVLIFLILIQLPKKEAGMGVAFGAGATDALFGAGSGSSALTKMTRYSTIVFLALALLLSILIARQTRTSNPAFGAGVDQAAAEAARTQSPAAGGPATPLVTPTPSGTGNVAAPSTGASNAAVPPQLENNPPPAETNK